MSDIIVLAKSFNSISGDLKYSQSIDLNRDGAINMSDVLIVAMNFNKTN